jgi:carbamoyltransferase
MWIQPAAGDAGGALGAALYVWHQIQGNERTADGRTDQMQGAYLGPRFERDEIRAYLDQNGYKYELHEDPEARAKRIAALIADEKVVGLCQGRMEFGPRALGHRSIVGDARSPKMQSIMNLKIKYRESFRPFAPSVLKERIGKYFELDVESPYMLLVADVQPNLRKEPEAPKNDDADLRTWVNEVRSEIPAITHVDYSARVQSVSKDRSPEYHRIISAFEEMTGCGVIINTSFNVRGEPIVCTPEDAYRCFMRTEMDYLVLDEFVLDKNQQPEFPDKDNWREDYVLD